MQLSSRLLAFGGSVLAIVSALAAPVFGQNNTAPTDQEGFGADVVAIVFAVGILLGTLGGYLLATKARGGSGPSKGKEKTPVPPKDGRSP